MQINEHFISRINSTNIKYLFITNIDETTALYLKKQQQMQTDTHQFLKLYLPKLLNNIKRVKIIIEYILLTGKHFIF